MDTVTVKTASGETFEIPVAFAFGPDGQPADLVGDVIPENCDHAGACWSSNLDMRCPRCGAKLFLPPRFLAGRCEEVLEAMYTFWEAAGWPEFCGGQVARWNTIPDKWTVLDHPLFAHVGGLPVRADKAWAFELVTA